MFKFFEKKEKLESLNVDDTSVVAMADGELIDICTVPDDIFSQKLMGETTAFDFGNEKVTICSPANGILSVLFPTGHAFGIQMKNGIELLVHVGIDTVSLEGEGFERLTEPGQQVKAGTPILKIDRDFILGKGLKLHTPVLITNPDMVKDMKPVIGETVTAGNDTVLTYKVK